MQKVFTVKISQSAYLPAKRLMVSADLFHELGLKPNQPLILRFGTNLTEAILTEPPDADADCCVLMDSETVRCLMLPLPLKICLAADQTTNQWRFGPLIGIFANRFSNHVKPFGEQSSFFRKLGNAAQVQNALCFAFSPSDIDWDNRTIRGSVPPPDDGPKEWQSLALPFPDVIYDRGLFPKGERRKKATAARKVLRSHPELKMFNPAFFGKWKTHRLLSRNQTLANHLPETRVLTSPTDVHYLLEKHMSVFIKPSGGSSGRGIIMVSAGIDGYTIKTRASRMITTTNSPVLEQFNTRLQELLTPQKYIVQQTLKLARFKGNPFDIRVLMQKNQSGSWRLTGMATRVAGQGNFITNIHAGGRAEKIDSVLIHAFGGELPAQQIVNNIRDLCFLIAAVVTAEGSPLFGEIAIDLGVDETGKVWIIELNAVPGRSVFRRLGMTQTSARAIARPMEYAHHLAGFAPQTDEKQNKEELF